MDQHLKQIASRNAGPWLDTREAEIRSARAAGERATTGNMGLLMRRHSDFEDGLLGRAKAAVLTMQSDLSAYGRDLRRQIEELSRERDDHIGTRMTELREARQRALHALENTKGPMSAPFIRAALAGEESEKSLRIIRAQVNGRPLRRSLVHIYLPAMMLLALIEVPVNRLAFELFFQEQPAVSLALAGAVGVVLIFFAHMIGTLFRRMEQQPVRVAQQIRRVMGVLLFSGLTGVLMYLLAGMRQLYVQLLESEQGGNLSAMIDTLTRGGAARTIVNVAHQPLGTAGWTLLILNIVLFVFGATFAFVRHDPHPDYEPAWRAQERSRRRLTRLRKRYEKAIHAKQQEYDRQLASLEQLHRETQIKYDELVAREAAIEPFLAETAARIANNVRNRSHAFLEGAISAIPKGPIEGSLAEVRAMSEGDIVHRIAEDLPARVILLRAALLLVLLASGAHAAEDYCAYGKGTAILFVDRTTAFDQTDKTLFLQAVDGVVAKLGPGDRLVAYTITGAFTESRKVFDRCKPACPEEGFFAGLVATCRPVVARADALGFNRDLAQAIATLLREPEETRYSDLFRTVAEDVRASSNPERPVRTVVVLSDLLENTTVMPEREFKRMPPPDILKRLSVSGIQVSLPGASVRVFGFGRDDSPGRPPLPQATRQRLLDVWRSWFVTGGATDVDIGFR